MLEKAVSTELNWFHRKACVIPKSSDCQLQAGSVSGKMNKSCDLCTLFQRRSLVVSFLNCELSELSQKKYSVSRILAKYLPVGIHLFSLVWTRYGRLVRSVLVC